ncbi:hypothetical protein QRB38_25740 [Mycobacterium avium subsp. hominissuis]|uniref:hypothetical protein n=3 Tax=Mycobacterium avium TaxID=1764 RepID=UPI0007A0BAA6|nr:hypothetical protein [Mycobacterium avium]MBG0730438.1 hypothetical protein [Mycobacterium avium]MBZ4511541.1 hypothetical protein [Mycobacterium avium subsp. hominissuis]MBZ4556987.1 hypothetical protein [Mycobacterium avium subsp. hominissuis]MBZ4575278.1 hypothetical protein [Mycobacterium avium subsp. hominissuis]MCA2240339.1 hypothetical protein [Mycobacterium avium]
MAEHDVFAELLNEPRPTRTVVRFEEAGPPLPLALALALRAFEALCNWLYEANYVDALSGWEERRAWLGSLETLSDLDDPVRRLAVGRELEVLLARKATVEQTCAVCACALTGAVADVNQTMHCWWLVVAGGAPAAVRAEFAAVSCRLIDTAIRVLLSPLRRPPRFGLSSAADVYRELAQRN